MTPPRRPIKRLLIANRGEIATRILSTARSLSIETYTLSLPTDTSHTLHSTHIIPISSPSTYLSIPSLLSIVQTHKIDAIHPGYGFLSESASFASVMLDQANAIVIGPGSEILERTGDKLKARQLAQECNVPVLPALAEPTADVDRLRGFVGEVGYPVILKAVDGGGGRGIRIVRGEEDLEVRLREALRESPGGLVFAEKAALEGYRHVEVQIVGDGKGEVRELGERECSIQRRFQKVVEFAPCSVNDRGLVGEVIEAAVRMAQRVNYFSLGTFEFLVSETTSPPSFYFLEINPRIQVEHTITESLHQNLDLVKIQLLLAQGHTLSSLLPLSPHPNPSIQLPIHSLQLRLTAEDPSQNFSLSPGKISSFQFPNGPGIRVDTHLHLHPSQTAPLLVGTDFDSLLAKIIITAPSWEEVVARAKVALEDTYVLGVATNLSLLRAIIANNDLVQQRCDTAWLERNLPSLLTRAKEFERGMPKTMGNATTATMVPSLGNVVLKPNDSWSIELTPDGSHETQAVPYHIQISRIQENNFPNSLKANILFSTPSSSSSASQPQPYHLSLASSTSSSRALSSHKKGDRSNPLHVNSPFPGRLIEVCVEVGEDVVPGQTMFVLRQMKMEVDVRCKVGGRVLWILGQQEEDEEYEDEGEKEIDIGEGVLVVELEEVEKKEKELEMGKTHAMGKEKWKL
ncbi:Pyruvate carboxylase protein [Rutstroemia sp. NJR-2017a BBW]|nr:Pyruvate carboxylase protein [Rutstroemia sp. NJR-2017a BBW]